jgi:hypothetical protein
MEMEGAREYARLFKTGQYEKLYIVSGEHARGKTFYVYVLPEKEQAISNGPNNGPLNKDAVLVYGIVGGNPGWTESYGWLHKGKWQEDFEKLKLSKEMELAASERINTATTVERDAEEKKRVSDLLGKYKEGENGRKLRSDRPYECPYTFL